MKQKRKCCQATSLKFPIYVHFVIFYALGVESNIDHITPLPTKTSSILQLLTKELTKGKKDKL